MTTAYSVYYIPESGTEFGEPIACYSTIDDAYKCARLHSCDEVICGEQVVCVHGTLVLREDGYVDIGDERGFIRPEEIDG